MPIPSPRTPDADDHLDRAVQLLRNLVHQFAIPIVRNGQPALSTGGLSTLEDAFDFLGMENPHPLKIQLNQ